MKVLVVDGNANHVSTLVREFTAFGIDAVGATTLVKAMAVIRKCMPDLILWQADFYLQPAWKSVYFLRSKFIKRFYFVAIHAFPVPGMLHRQNRALCEECGADEFVAKPFMCTQLLEWAGKARERFSQQKENKKNG